MILTEQYRLCRCAVQSRGWGVYLWELYVLICGQGRQLISWPNYACVSPDWFSKCCQNRNRIWSEKFAHGVTGVFRFSLRLEADLGQSHAANRICWQTPLASFFNSATTPHCSTPCAMFDNVPVIKVQGKERQFSHLCVLRKNVFWLVKTQRERFV